MLVKPNIVNKFLVLIFITLSVIIQGCGKDSFCNCFENTGSVGSETRLLNGFTKIEMENNVDIILKHGNQHQAIITCGKNLIDGIVTEVKDDVLYIRNKNKCNWIRDFKNKFTVEITYNQLEYIVTRGAGHVTCADTLKSPRFQVDSWNGTGVLDFIIDCNEVYFKLHTGPADIFASGKADIMYLYTAGNGFIKTAAVESDFTYVTTKSTGDCEVSAAKVLDVIIEYHGDIYYKGEPDIINTEITGSGKLIPF